MTAPTLNDPDLFRQQAFIAGAWVDADDGRTIPVDDPATGAIIGHVPDCGAPQARAAIDAAARAQADWKHRPPAERAAILMAWYDLMLEHSEDLARIMTIEQGKILAEALGEVRYAASFFKWFAEEARRIDGAVLAPPARDRRILVLKEPVGVSAAITPWNFPLAMITRKCAPALAAGCSMVIKPSELTPFSALAVARLGERAGVPAGLISIVTGMPEAIGAELTANPVVRKLSFTGSTRVGAILMRQSADTIKRLSLELGGNAPFLVFDDAACDLAVQGAMASKFRNAGQTCICANRVLVQSGIHDRFVAHLLDAVAALRVGSGLDPAATLGPLINDAAVAKVRAHVEDALARGARYASAPLHVDGRFVSPVVLTGVTADMLIAREETFGPVLPVFRFDTEEEAVRLANATPFGLASYFFTGSLDRAWRVGEALEFGMVGLNTGAISMESAPFGGVKQSGLGREGGHPGLDEFLEIKSFHMGGLGSGTA
ncbi:NAD-dependent succinate-semialdehyde dehydrogenase [Gluconacetobacter diazotrophicus]|uniref:NAD-dependent succinate-semialdehyde dehydrogenase n=2 Tax=Gluconacetobacter diazotrophicus TaxID=33996 RepID=A0A7W4I6X4_GLUDI|nr:NAD-dependent succinate-semialdehyde dehydrogenase [Gluconacetobacter diazotrophicus]MBB2157389.1 NAD-dependent succinate-semialdehyde dehydrogenase [Gluconacetobacter diazotrophicus]CAP54361.1 putative succinate-semialdehyde dehydrogenase [Gluconacetobacter diazotrophicus PA1 5]